MKILHIICSFDSANLTKRLYEELLPQTKDLIVLENSTTEEKKFDCPHTIDIGRDNVGFGGMHDWIWKHKSYTEKYDFVAIYNNDVFDIPKNFCNDLPKYLDKTVGIATPALNDEGTGWPHMRKKGDWIREADHVEDAIGIFNTKLFKTFKKYSPMNYYGVLDISLCMLSKREGFRNIIIDALPVKHMLAGARKEAGVFTQYHNDSPGGLYRWFAKFPDLQRMYEDYVKRYDGVSVIIPNYNHNHLLKRAIESVKFQPVKTEVVLVDDCSPNQDYSSIKGLDITFIKNKQNKGLAATRNVGISNSFYNWILPLDADDELKPGALGKLFENRRADIIYGYAEYRNGGLLPSRQVIDPLHFYNDNQLCGSSLYHKDVWRNVNGYNEDHHEYYEDWSFWGKAALRGYKFLYQDLCIYTYQGDGDGMCARLGKDRPGNVQKVRDIYTNFKEWLIQKSKS